jgi:hypothetical protein
MTAPIANARSRSRGAMRPSCAFISRPHGGRGECRVPAAPAASCALCIGRTHTSNNEYTGTPGIPARNGFTAYFVLSPVTGLFCHRRLRTYVVSAPGRADPISATLTPASGRQDHTTSPYVATSLVRVLSIAHRFIIRPAIPLCARRCRVHRIPCPTSVTIAKRPSVWDGMRKVLDVIWGV